MCTVHTVHIKKLCFHKIEKKKRPSNNEIYFVATQKVLSVYKLFFLYISTVLMDRAFPNRFFDNFELRI